MEYDGQCDVYSFGIVLLELITRRKVSEALQRSPMEAFDLDEKKTRALLPKDCPPDFAELAFQCCRYEPNDRPSFRDIVRTLTEMIKKGSFQDANSVSSSSASPPPATPFRGIVSSSSSSPLVPSSVPIPSAEAWGPVDPFAVATPIPLASATGPMRGGPALRRAGAPVASRAGYGSPRGGGPGGPPRGGGGGPRGGMGPPRGGAGRGGPGGSPRGAPRGGPPRGGGGAPRGSGGGGGGPGSPGQSRAPASLSSSGGGGGANSGGIRFVSRSGPTSESIVSSESYE